MTPDKVYNQLEDLHSKDVLVINNYHGLYSADRIRKYPNVVYTCFGEAFNYPAFKSLMDSAPDTRFFIVTCREYLLTHADQKKCHVFYIPSAYGQYADYVVAHNFDLNKKNLIKTFLSLNFRSQWNRQALAHFLVQTGLIDNFYFSYHAHDRFGKGYRELYDETNQIIGKTWFNQFLDLEQFYQLLPILTGLHDPLQHDNDWSFGIEKYYQETFCSFVNETYIDENHDVFFTEKTFKPMAYGHPFLLFSSAGALASLRSMGFETFATVFDESYDLIESPQKRFEHLLLEVQRICMLPQKEFNSIHKAIIPTLSHNRDHFSQTLPQIYSMQIQRIQQDIQDILKAVHPLH